ncbi:hypothetical protein BO71DRAFT_397019 [Aspergillus ellipticus CBS 707.79]|uniref:Zn(2)-C6 fungal-type domain-containing protein n=1 Tax=Aspergillus ellipticus CBS 707.79 TaxID=1448320 RepID=A0A319DR49_9EURO|nr:hypothetical protein BO71DRAFT_397019 [Aspergillus ellipticus CBS 707.79]
MSNTPVAIAPAPSRPSPSTGHGGDSPNQNTSRTAYTCLACVKRKVKCDRSLPECSSCSKAKIECVYEAPHPRVNKRKRRRSVDVHERLAHYEKILQDYGLLSPDSLPSRQNTQEPLPRFPNQPDTTAKVGKLLSGDGKSRYIDSNLWLNSGEANMQVISDNDEATQPASGDATPMTQDPVSGALLGLSHNLTESHPTHQDAMKLWSVHIQNVEPLCKILHIPTTGQMVENVSQRPCTASRAQECLLFAIYHFAIFSLTDQDCIRDFGQSQSTLLAKYQFAIRQALVNASWLKTTEMPVIQAYALFLISMRTLTDPHTLWMWTGVAIRIAQRMGLHRDGESLGLPPFEVEMRRRLFWQLLPLDGYAGQLSGTGISLAPDSWDTKQPLNINDDQIYPGMTEPPKEVNGASEMIFCRTKTELSNLYARKGIRVKTIGGTLQFRENAEMEHLIDEVEGNIETKYLRYCDIINPLHLLTMGSVRLAANAVRLRNRMGGLIKHSISDSQRRDLCSLAQKILDTDAMMYSNPQTRRFMWYSKAFFLWDALICILSSLVKVGFFSRQEVEDSWRKVKDIYEKHPEILQGKQLHHVAVMKATLDAWFANPLLGIGPEPGFIAKLRAQESLKSAGRSEKVHDDEAGPDNAEQSASSFDVPFGGISGDLSWDAEVNLGGVDWMFWEQF